MVMLFICDVIGGPIGVASGAETWGTAWGFDTHSTVPVPMGPAQLVLAWLAAVTCGHGSASSRRPSQRDLLDERAARVVRR
jgi:hypothetical protein